MKNKSLFLVLGLTLGVLAPLTTFNLLDTFYFKHKQGTIVDVLPSNFDPGQEGDHTTVEYVTGEHNIKGANVVYHLLKIHVNSLHFFLSGFASDENNNYGVNITQSLSDMIKDVKDRTGRSVLGAITGDFPFWSTSRKGYVVRNGVVYRKSRKSRNSIRIL